MTRDPLAQVAGALARPSDLRIRPGTVSSVTPLEVTIAGEPGLPASRLASYTPVVDHLVLVVQQETSLIVLGRILSGG